jgi:hypothetical protein
MRAPPVRAGLLCLEQLRAVEVDLEQLWAVEVDLEQQAKQGRSWGARGDLEQQVEAELASTRDPPAPTKKPPPGHWRRHDAEV